MGFARVRLIQINDLALPAGAGRTGEAGRQRSRSRTISRLILLAKFAKIVGDG
jgi:hypothetical protein